MKDRYEFEITTVTHVSFSKDEMSIAEVWAKLEDKAFLAETLKEATEYRDFETRVRRIS